MLHLRQTIIIEFTSNIVISGAVDIGTPAAGF
jgi:hypothetical protein